MVNLWRCKDYPMDAQHFKELINSVCKTVKLPKYKIASLIGVDVFTLNIWERKGVPVRIKPYVMSVLRKVLFEEKCELHKIK